MTMADHSSAAGGEHKDAERITSLHPTKNPTYSEQLGTQFDYRKELERRMKDGCASKDDVESRIFSAALALFCRSVAAYHAPRGSAQRGAGLVMLEHFCAVARAAGYKREDILRTMLAKPNANPISVVAELERAARCLGADGFVGAVEAAAKATGMPLQEVPTLKALHTEIRAALEGVGHGN